ncbi:protein DpdD [Paraburkholderia tropica]|uniref:protein DpdD n=1 Tax=Paraburkholderia tropica TaxID=92647 RepID=UPI002AB75A6A|nr:protein DpdD [Paraburkholderia tropica]
MDLQELADSERSWLDAYVARLVESSPTSLDRDAEGVRVTGAETRAWLKFWSGMSDTRPLVLPLAFDSDGAIAWLACADSDLLASEMREELIAHVGDAYTDFSPLSRLARPYDAITRIATERFRWVYKFEGGRGSENGQIWSMLGIYRTSMSNRPERYRPTPQTFGSLRLRFERAITAGDGAEAYRVLEQLKGTGRLNAQNERFLEIHLLAGLGHWSPMVAGETKLLALRDLSLPRQTLSEAVEALYFHYLAVHENDADLAGATATFNEKIRPRFAWLFRARRSITRPAVLKAFALNELSRERPDGELLATLRNELQSSGEPLLPQWFPDTKTDVETADWLNEGDMAFEDAEYERAMAFYTRAPESQHALQRILECAIEVASLEATQEALDVLGRYPATVQAALGARYRRKIEQLQKSTDVAQSAADGENVVDWKGWARAVKAGLPGSEASRLAVQKAEEWRLSDYTSYPEAVGAFVAEIDDYEDAALRTYVRSIPPIIEFFDHAKGMPEVQRLHQTLLTLILLEGNDGLEELDSVQRITATLLQSGISSAEYRELVADLQDMLRRVGSPRYLDWVFDIVELFASFPRPDEEAPLRLFFVLLQLVNQYSHRLRADQWRGLELLAQDFNQQPAISELLAGQSEAGQQQHTDFEHLANKSVGIYTLTESAGQRAAQILASLVPSCHVELNSDHVATARLKQLAANADVFVFAWRSSKHQAYFAIKDARGNRSDLLLPEGKGSASILKVLSEAIV